jgi:hypothetical protein
MPHINPSAKHHLEASGAILKMDTPPLQVPLLDGCWDRLVCVSVERLGEYLATSSVTPHRSLSHVRYGH